MVIAVLDSPGLVGVHGGSCHQDIDFTSWHEAFLWYGKVFVHNPGISVFSVGGNSLGEVFVLGVIPPDGSVLSEVGITTGIVKFFTGTNVNEVLLVVPFPLLAGVTSESVMDNSSSFLLGQNHIVSRGVGLFKMEPHASVWLHGGGNWLLVVFSEFWGSVAFNDLNIKVDIRVEWDWLSSNWCPGTGSTPSVVRWAGKSGLRTLLELWHGEVPA